MSGGVDILAFGAHPDDAEIGCGATLALSADRGLRVAVVDLTAGERATRGTVSSRAEEAERAAAILGLCQRRCLGLPDGDVGGAGEAGRQAVVAVLRDLRPTVVLSPFPADRHPDHAAAARLVEEACFWAGVGEKDGNAPHRPRQLYHYMIHHAFQPSLVVDASPGWSRKIEAVQAYVSQFDPNFGAATALSDGRFLRHIEARAIWFGGMIGADYGEPFACKGPVAADILPVPPGTTGSMPPYSIGG